MSFYIHNQDLLLTDIRLSQGTLWKQSGGVIFGSVSNCLCLPNSCSL